MLLPRTGSGESTESRWSTSEHEGGTKKDGKKEPVMLRFGGRTRNPGGNRAYMAGVDER